MTAHKDLKFFATQPHECSYLTDQEATTLFMDPDISLEQPLYSKLADLGFRRSGRHIYRPHCANCNSCIPARIPVRLFSRRRSQRKAWNKNQDLNVSQHKACFTEEYFELYASYINSCHKDGDMYPATKDQFTGFLVDSPELCRFYEFRLEGQLIAVSVVDTLASGFSAIYTFYTPKLPGRSLGKFCILWLINETHNQGLEYFHMGYWIRHCRKMSYKIEYRPIELYVNQRWTQLS